ncbi:hypothetical protein K435DRAFT_847584 [Dendrothele bispora CBS 962.96]|uniref:Myb/SANT-like domain-containing protein n=1 Tax=Dendrothele bispora (strain CBS 962.96) TaxID=1314807 RepID=A0A4V4HIT1_DENBC|nr:hypothetical protein K435DRAFT_847584 [Dendrothele bispora CBS 962.96]
MPRENAASWSEKDKAALVDYLHEARFEIGDGGNWTAGTLKGAEAHLAATVTLDKGGPKTVAAIRTQWNALKKIYSGIREVIDGKASGLTWTHDKGCNITELNEHVWRGFIKTRSHMKPFKNTGWPLFDKMDDMVPTRVTGQHVFNASQMSTTPTASQTQASVTSDSQHIDMGLDDNDDSLREDNDTPTGSISVPNTPAPHATPAPQSLGKRTSASDLDTPVSKRGKITGPEAIMSMSQSVLSIGDALRDAFGSKGDPSPVRKKQAQAMLRDDEACPGLTRDQKVRLHITYKPGNFVTQSALEGRAHDSDQVYSHQYAVIQAFKVWRRIDLQNVPSHRVHRTRSWS